MKDLVIKAHKRKIDLIKAEIEDLKKTAETSWTNVSRVEAGHAIEDLEEKLSEELRTLNNLEKDDN